MKHKKALIILLSVFALLAIAASVLGVLLWNGVILINSPGRDQFPVRGVDVSAYQGEIDWQVLADQDIDFAFIKATEGSSFTDSRFQYNFTEALKTDLRIGAYHFFSFDSPGKAQGEHFIKTVEKAENMLPPVIDFEFYGGKEDSPPDAEETRRELGDMISLLEAHYGVNPIIYVSAETYNHYISGHFEECPIWYRNVYGSELTKDGRPCDFWQYTNRERLKGYSGEERFIDMNVFFGSKEEFAAYGLN